MAPDDFMTQAQFAQAAHLHPRTVARMRTTGDGPAFLKLGHSVRYRVSDVERWLDSRTFISQAQQNGREAA